MKQSPRIAVVGGGLGGISAARLLEQEGYTVSVYEQASSFGRHGAGIHLGPNLVRILIKIGIGDRLLETGVQPESWISRDWETNEILFEMPLFGVSEKLYGAPYLTVHRGDLHVLLIDTLNPGTLHFDKKLKNLKEEGDVVRLLFEDGTSAEADIVIGADGVNSYVREALLGPEAPIFTGVVGHRALFPASLLGDFKIKDFTKWWHPDRHIIVYNITASRDEVYFVTGAPEEEWTSPNSFVPCSKQELMKCFDGFHEEAIRIIRHAPDDAITKWAFFERDPLPFWSKGRTVMLGDACHPMKPHMGQGAAMAIEDAAMLLRCLMEVGLDDHRMAFKLYEANRHSRTARVQLASRSNTWLRDPTDPSWVFAYDVFNEPLVQPEEVA